MVLKHETWIKIILLSTFAKQDSNRAGKELDFLIGATLNITLSIF
jgi:hypothetical protein